MTHWCQNVPRDEAVRAAEDKRQGPLPTLQEAIARAGQLMPQEAQKGPECPERESVTERRPPEPRGGGNVTGLRTERVTLEVTHDLDAPLGDWIVQVLDESLGFDETVRVVDTHAQAVAESVAWEGARDAYRGRIARLTDERDAAIRERDTLRAERITQALTADRFAAAVQEADRLRARVAELQSAAKLAPAANADGGSNHAALAASGAADEEDFDIGYALRLFVDGRRVLSHELDRQQAGAFLIAAEHLAKYLRTEYQPPVEEAAPAASGAAGTGWLTGDERLAVSGAILILDQHGPTNIGRTLNDLLARETPPEVVLPRDIGGESYDSFVAGWNNHRDEALKALAAAGVTVKEVGA